MMDYEHSSFAFRIIIMRRLARDLNEPIDNIEKLANKFLHQLGILPEQFEVEPEIRKDVLKFFDQIWNLSLAADEGLGTMKEYGEAIAPIGKLSRDLRPGMRRLHKASAMLHGARDITNSWVELIKNSGINYGHE